MEYGNDLFNHANHTNNIMNARYFSILLIFVVNIAGFGIADAEPETQANGMVSVYLLRHTEKELDVKQNPPLTETGVERAHYWTFVLQDIQFDAVYSTDTLRTRETAKPIAQSNTVEITLYQPQSLTRESLLKDHAGQNILIVGHSNTIAELSNQLIRQKKFQNLDEKSYSNLFIVSLTEHFAKAQKLNITLP